MNKTEMLDKSLHLLTQAEAERDALQAALTTERSIWLNTASEQGRVIAELREIVNAAQLLRTTSEGYMENACQPTWVRLRDAQFAFDTALAALTAEALGVQS